MELAKKIEQPEITENTALCPDPTKKYTLEEAFQYCLDITRNHYENFPVASLAIPRKLRPYIASVYAFARTADDFADEKEHDGFRMTRLKDWETKLKECLDEEPSHPIFIALKETIQEFIIPVSLFSDLLTAFKMDVVVSRYQTFEQVLNYCRFSANPVGRIILYIFGYPVPKFLEYSDYICTALQLANFWQDVAVDLEKDRIYIPEEDFKRFNYSEEELHDRSYNENFRRLIAFQVERTQELFNQGKFLCGKIPGRLGFELRLTWMGGTTILKKLQEVNGDIFSHRPVLKKRDLPGLIFSALKKKGFI